MPPAAHPAARRPWPVRSRRSGLPGSGCRNTTRTGRAVPVASNGGSGQVNVGGFQAASSVARPHNTSAGMIQRRASTAGPRATSVAPTTEPHVARTTDVRSTSRPGTKSCITSMVRLRAARPGRQRASRAESRDALIPAQPGRTDRQPTSSQAARRPTDQACRRRAGPPDCWPKRDQAGQLERRGRTLDTQLVIGRQETSEEQSRRHRRRHTPSRGGTWSN